jgi:hypothetical protein
MSQTFENHARYYPWHHFVVQPILLLNVLIEAARLYKYQTLYHVYLIVFAIGLLIFSFTARSMALRAQNRVIRLEEQLRLTRLLPATDHALIDKLTPGQLVALRFASDEEVPDLARKCAAGEFSSGKEIKQSIRTWRPDYLRV